MWNKKKVSSIVFPSQSLNSHAVLKEEELKKINLVEVLLLLTKHDIEKMFISSCTEKLRNQRSVPIVVVDLEAFNRDLI